MNFEEMIRKQLISELQIYVEENHMGGATFTIEFPVANLNLTGVALL